MNGDLARLLDELEAAQVTARRSHGKSVLDAVDKILTILPTLIAELRRRDAALAAVRGLAEKLEGRSQNGGVWTVWERVAYGDVADRLRAVLAAHEQAEEATP